MTYTQICEVLNQDESHEASVCRAINAWLSRNKFRKLMLTRSVFQKVDRGVEPGIEFLLVPFNTPKNPVENYNNLTTFTRYSMTKKSNLDEGFITVEGKTVIISNNKTGNVTVAGIIGDEDMTPIEWPVLVSKAPVKLPKEDVTLTNEMALRAIEKGMRELPLDIKARHSHGGLRERYTYVQTLTEYAVAAAMTEGELNGSWLPTHLRTLRPLPFGGVSAQRVGKFSEEDKLQMKGIDIQHLPRTADKNRKTPITKGQAFDVKLIASVGSGPYKDVPVEAFIQKANNFIFEDETMWTWNPKGVADFVFVLRNTAYVISKDTIQKEVRNRVQKFRAEGCRRSDSLRPNMDSDSKGRLKWNVWLTEKELEALSIQSFALPALYGELLAKHAYEPLLDYYSDNQLGEYYTERHLRFFNPSI